MVITVRVAAAAVVLLLAAPCTLVGGPRCNPSVCSPFQCLDNGLCSDWCDSDSECDRSWVCRDNACVNLCLDVDCGNYRCDPNTGDCPVGCAVRTECGDRMYCCEPSDTGLGECMPFTDCFEI